MALGMIAQTGTQSTDRAAQLLVRVVESPEPLAVGELAAVTGLPKSTASRLIGSLERAGLLQRAGLRGGLRPGPVLLRFAQRGIAGDDILALAEPELRHLAALSGETVNLAVAGPLGPETIAEIETRHVLGTGGWVGRRGVPLHASAFGKVFLSCGAMHLPPGELAVVRAPHDHRPAHARGRAGAGARDRVRDGGRRTGGRAGGGRRTRARRVRRDRRRAGHLGAHAPDARRNASTPSVVSAPSRRRFSE